MYSLENIESVELEVTHQECMVDEKVTEVGTITNRIKDIERLIEERTGDKDLEAQLGQAKQEAEEELEQAKAEIAALEEEIEYSLSELERLSDENNSVLDALECLANAGSDVSSAIQTTNYRAGILGSRMDELKYLRQRLHSWLSSSGESSGESAEISGPQL